jgi:hypothetical protein
VKFILFDGNTDPSALPSRINNWLDAQSDSKTFKVHQMNTCIEEESGGPESSWIVVTILYTP